MIKSVIFYDTDDVKLKEFADEFKEKAYAVYAGYGYKANQLHLEDLIRVSEDIDFSIITNDLHIFGDSRVHWNEEENHTQAYIVINGEPKRIDTLTEKWIRKAHNIECMYIAGAFEVE